MPKAKSSVMRQLATYNDCKRGYHQWQDTLTTGLALCVICGTYGVCPVCFSGPSPHHACVRACPRHTQPHPEKVQIALTHLPDAAAQCTAGIHRWVKTAATGVFQCAICRSVGYCFTCYPQAPKEAIAAPCANHRAQERRVQA